MPLARLALLLSLAALAACKSRPATVQVDYDLVPRAPLPATLRKIAIPALEAAPGSVAATAAAVDLADLLAAELAGYEIVDRKQLLRTPPASSAPATPESAGHTARLAQAHAAGAQAVVVGRVHRNQVSQIQAERMSTRTDSRGHPIRGQVADVRFKIDLAAEVQLVEVATGRTLATLGFERRHEADPLVADPQRRLAELVPKSDLAARLLSGPDQPPPGRDDLQAAFLQQCAREFRDLVVPFKKRFTVPLLPDGQAVRNGVELLHEGLPERAVEVLLAATATRSDRTDVAWYTLGVAYEQLKRYPDAKAAYDRALTVAEAPAYREALARVQRHGR